MMGTGEHARQLAAALETQRVPVATTTIHPDKAPEDERLVPRGDSSLETVAERFADFNLLCVNADVLPQVAAALGGDFFRGRYTVGFWAWEVSAFPDRWLSSFGELDEVWVGSEHVREAIAGVATVPVIRIPQPVSLPEGAASAEPPAGLPEGFRFVFAFDYLSVSERKNPLATVRAFTRAFSPGSGTCLIIKTLNQDIDPSAHERLRAAAATHPDVHVIDQRLSHAQRNGLLGAADCYVSLHRAEGFGYTLAESMWLGRPVVATGYSGNLDFMTPENSYLVDHRLVPIGAGNDPYPADGLWAEPDVDHAAKLMREVFEHRDEARRRAERGARDIRASHGPQAAGSAMVKRLTLLSTDRGSRRGRRDRPDHGDVAELIRSGPVAPGRPRFGAPQRAARKALLRLLKPVTVHERHVDEQLLSRIEELESEVSDLRSRDRG